MAFLRDEDEEALKGSVDKNLVKRSETSKAFRQGVLNLRASLSGAAAAGGALVGQEEFAEEQLAEAEKLSQRAAEEAPEVQTLEQVKDVPSALAFTRNTVVSQLPNIATLLATHRVGRVLGRGGRKRMAAVAPEAVERAGKIGSTTGTIGGASALETGSIFPETAADPEAREKYSLQELAGQAVVGGTAAGSLEAIQPMHVFDKFGVGKAGRSAIKKALKKKGISRRMLEEAAAGTGREGLTEGVQTVIERATHKFANENFEVFGEEGINEIINATVAGGLVGGTLSSIGGIPDPGKFEQRVEDLESQDELDVGEAQRTAEFVAAADPEAAADLEGIDLTAPGALQEVNDIAESRNIDVPDTRSSRIARGHAKDFITDQATFQDELLPALQEIALGNIEITPEIQQQLEENFDDPGKMLDKLAEQAGVHTGGQFELLELERGVEAGTIEATSEVQNRINQLVGEGVTPEFESLQETADQEGLDEGEATQVQKEFVTGEADPEYQSINVQDTDGKKTMFRDQEQSVPFVSSEASSKLAGREVENSQVRNVRELNEQAGEEAFTLRKYTEVFLEQESRKGTVSDKKSLFDVEARRILKANPKLEPLAKSVKSSKQFLDSLEVIEQPGVEPKAEVVDFDESEVNSLLKKASKPGTKLPRGVFQVSVDGVDKNVNAHDITRKVLEAKGIGFTSSRKEIAQAFFEGVTSLLSSKAKDIKFLESFDDNLVVYTPKRGDRGVKYRAIKASGAKNIKSSLDAIEAALETTKDATQRTELEEVHAKVSDILSSVRKREKVVSERSKPSAIKKVLGDVEAGKEARRVAEREPKAAAEREAAGQGAGGGEGAQILKGKKSKVEAVAQEFLRKSEYYLNAGSKTYEEDMLGLATGLGLGTDINTAAEAIELAESLAGYKFIEQRERRKKKLDEYLKEELAEPSDLRFSNRIAPSDEYMREQEKPGDLDAFQKTATQWLADLGIKKDITMLTYDQAKKIFEDRGRDAIRLIDGTNRGFMKTNKDGTYSIYISPIVGKKQALEILGHEVGHIIFKETVLDLSTKNAKSVRASFEEWRAQFGRSATLSDIYLSKQPLEIMMDAMSQEGSNKLLDDMSHADRAYLLDFEEWFADNTAKWMVTNTKAVGVVDQFFSHIADLIKSLAQNVLANAPDKAVRQFLDDMLAKEVSARAKANLNSTPRNKLPKDLLEAVQKAVGLTPRFKRGTKAAAEYTNKDGVRAINMSANLDHNPYDELANQSARAAFDFLLTPKERGILGTAFTSLHMQRQLRKLLEGNPEAQYEVKNDPEAAAAYAYQFWIAGELKLGPKATGLFERVVSFVTDVLGIVREHKQAEQLFKALRSGVLKQRADGEATFVVEQRVSDTMVRKSARFAELTTSSILPFLGKVFYTADGAIRATKNAHLIKLAEKFHARVGTEGIEETMFTARNRRMGRFKKRLSTIFEKAAKDKVFGERVVHLLNSNEKPATEEERQAVGKVRALFKEMRDYAVEHGVEVGDLNSPSKEATYFPRVYDMEQLKRNHDKFIDALAQSKYDSNLFAKEFENNAKFKPTQEKRIKAAQRIYETLLSNQGLADVQLNPEKTVHTPYFGSINKRDLAWIHATDLAPFLSKELGLTVTTYIEQSVKRAEYTSRFGKDGKGIEELIEKAKASGASDSDISMARKYIEAMMGTLGSDIDPKWHKFQGGVMVYENLRLLSLSTLTSLVDVAGIAVRGDLNTAWQAYKAGVDEIKAKIKGNKTALRQMAEALGTIDQYATNEALGWEYGGHHLTGLGKQINEKFFEYIQLQRWTRATRIMGLAGAKAFLESYAKGTSRHSERFLTQLNLSASDVKLDKDGSLQLLTHEQRKDLDVDSAEFKRDERVRGALNRWVDEAILRPDAAQRPIWASDPHWMLLFHLKAFIYSFHDRILKRVSSEFYEGNYAPMMLLGGYVPVMMASDLLREVLFQGLFDGDDADDYKKNWTFFDYVANSAERAGLNGIPQLGYDAMQDVQYGGDGITGLAGPTVGHVRDIAKLFTENSNTTAWEAFVESLPANNIYKRWDFTQ